MGCPALELAGRWVELGLIVETESSRQLILCGAGTSLVVQCPEVGSSTSEAQAWHPARTPRPCQPHGFWEVSGLLLACSRCSVGVVPHVDLFLMYLWGGGWSPHLTSLPSWSVISHILLIVWFWCSFRWVAVSMFFPFESGQAWDCGRVKPYDFWGDLPRFPQVISSGRTGIWC